MDGLDHARVHRGGDGRVHGDLCQEGDAVLLGFFLHTAGAVDLVLPAAVRAAEIAHVLHDAQNGNVHQPGHLDGLFHDHTHQLLRSGDDDDPLDGQGLKHRQGHVAGAGRHIHIHIVHIVPQNLAPELLHRAGDHRAAPDHRVRLVLQQQVDAHHLQAAFGHGGQNAVLAALRAAVDAEGLGDGGAGDVGIQNGGLMAPQLGLGSQQGGDQGLAHTALAADNGVYVLDGSALGQRRPQVLGILAGSAVFAAGGTIVGAVFSAHKQCSLLCLG